VRVLKHSEPILLAGIPESTLLKFIAQYVGKPGDAKLEIGHGNNDSGAIGLDAISGATVTVIAENQVISRSAYEIGRQAGIFSTSNLPGDSRAHPTAWPLPGRLTPPPREKDILDCLARGDSNKLIARKLDLAESTVKIHVQNDLTIWLSRNSEV
jgi:DNA-binding CsgD family transcriptional regulator